MVGCIKNRNQHLTPNIPRKGIDRMSKSPDHPSPLLALELRILKTTEIQSTKKCTYFHTSPYEYDAHPTHMHGIQIRTQEAVYVPWHVSSTIRPNNKSSDFS
ncbi:hypothetical protein COCNU_06G010430 [Cocos nucifera]|uniref:Uncharacterized protein n=1 Tax=Cocos nucifera TaxID=13894 RepID=A0A8K0N392_COCNU|nr:hypothetical protein COCNU_06G010430 [Cocos nucifera]